MDDPRDSGSGHNAVERESVSLTAVAEAVEGSGRLLPELLSALTDDAPAVRIGAAWALCALAEDEPGVVEYLTERVVERMDDGDEPFEVGQVLAFLRGRYPGRAGAAVDVAVDRSLERPDDDGRPGSAGVTQTGVDRGVSSAGSGDAPGGTQVETDGGVPAGTVADLGDNRQVVRPDGGAPGVHRRPVEPGGPGGATSPGPGDAPTGPAPGRDVPTDHPTHPGFDQSTPPVTEAEYRPETPETFASVAALSGFDQLSAVDEGVETRFATAYRCRAIEDGEECGVSVRLFDRPDESDRLDFCAGLEECLARWQALGSEEYVVGVVEWSERPRPWVATAPLEETLADRERPLVGEALWHALRLAEAVGYLHHNGAVHGGIEPRTVVYRGDTFDELARPVLDSAGLMDPFRQCFDPREYLDPRFVAPEYFDDSFGCVDAATDVYALGAVSYYLLTGRPPATGSFAAVRRQTLRGTPPAPTEVNDALPDGIDDVLSRALAGDKLARYESAEAFYRDVERVRDRTT